MTLYQQLLDLLEIALRFVNLMRQLFLDALGNLPVGVVATDFCKAKVRL